MGRYCRNKRIHKLVVELLREGWKHTKGAHNRLTHPNGGFVIYSDTPSDGNAHHAFERDIAKVKAGEPIRPRKVA